MSTHTTSQVFKALTMAHYHAARNNQGNISATIALNAYVGSGNFNQAIAAGVLSMGDKHAPLIQARELLQEFILCEQHEKEFFINNIRWILQNRKNGKRIPGFGHSFYKDQIDPAFHEAIEKYTSVVGIYPDTLLGKISNKVDEECYKEGLMLYPNAAMITACICEEFGAPPGAELEIALKGRIPAWIAIINEWGIDQMPKPVPEA